METNWYHLCRISVGGCQRRNLVDCEYVVPLVTFFVNGVTKDDLLWHYMFRFEIILRALLLGGGGWCCEIFMDAYIRDDNGILMWRRDYYRTYKQWY